MRVFNETKYSTEDLRRIFAACVTKLRVTEGSAVSGLRVSVIDHAHGANWIGGYAYYHSKRLTLKMPKKVRRDPEGWLQAVKTRRNWWDDKATTDYVLSVTAAKVADVFLHEVGHCLGTHHCKGETIETAFADWVKSTFNNNDAFPLRLKSELVVPKQKPDIKLVRFERAKLNLAKAETRFKRSKTILGKWKSRVRYYSKIFESAAKSTNNCKGE